MTQKAIAKECADWIKEKVTFKSNISDKTIQGQLVVDDIGYTPINNFTTVELGCEKGNVISTTISLQNNQGFQIFYLTQRKGSYRPQGIGLGCLFVLFKEKFDRGIADNMRSNNTDKVPIWEKANLTIREAAEYSNPGPDPGGQPGPH